VLPPVSAFGEHYRPNKSESRSCEPADHERHLPSWCLRPSGSGRPRYGRQTLRSVVPAHLRSSCREDRGPLPVVRFLSLNPRLSYHQLRKPARPKAASYAGRLNSLHRLVASSTANTAARSGLCRTSAVPVSSTVSRPLTACTVANTISLSSA